MRQLDESDPIARIPLRKAGEVDRRVSGQDIKAYWLREAKEAVDDELEFSGMAPGGLEEA